MSDILCIYYSRTGHTRRAVKEIAEALGAEITAITDDCDRSGWRGYMRCGMDAMKTSTRPLQPFETEKPLGAGKYQFLALAGQNAYADQLVSGRAKFVRTEPANGSDIKKLEVNLDHQSRGDYDEVENHAMPLDTLWHGKMLESVEVSSSEAAYATIPLVRDTKKINVALRDLDSPQDMDVNDYTMTIEDHNARILWDNSLDESRKVVYTPHATWNTVDETEQGKIAHADFMTSRILKHDDYKQDGHLLIKSKETGNTVVNVNLPDLLSRLRTSEEYSYSAQEFLDRAYDYKLQFFIQGGKLKYCYITISVNVLSWSKRIQFEELN